MKYLYKNTGVVVESGLVLDSTLYTPVNEKADVKIDEAKSSETDKAPRKKAASKK